MSIPYSLLHDFGPAAAHGFLGFTASIDGTFALLAHPGAPGRPLLFTLRDGKERAISVARDIQIPPLPLGVDFLQMLSGRSGDLTQWQILDQRGVVDREALPAAGSRTYRRHLVTNKGIVRLICERRVIAAQLDGSVISAVGAAERDVANFKRVAAVNAIDDDVWFVADGHRFVRWGDRAVLEVWRGAPNAVAFAFMGDSALFCTFTRVGTGPDASSTATLQRAHLRHDHTLALDEQRPLHASTWRGAVGVGRRLYLCDGQRVFVVDG